VSILPFHQRGSKQCQTTLLNAIGCSGLTQEKRRTAVAEGTRKQEKEGDWWKPIGHRFSSSCKLRRQGMIKTNEVSQIRHQLVVLVSGRTEEKFEPVRNSLPILILESKQLRQQLATLRG
jgi:hypothetical protein